jgi:hypothetical protein
MTDDDAIDGPVAKTGNDPYGLSLGSWKPNRVALESVTEYLLYQPEQGDMDWDDHCAALAGGILCSLAMNGKEVVQVQGKAHWIWNDDLNMHIPCCSVVDSDGVWCGNGPLLDSMIEAGDCGEHS